jgi:hypothetical protein
VARGGADRAAAPGCRGKKRGRRREPAGLGPKGRKEREKREEQTKSKGLLNLN